MPTVVIAALPGNVHTLEAVLRDSRFELADRVVVLGAAPAPTGHCWAGKSRLVGTDYDVDAAVEAVLASG
jgi:hypothetical protein